MSDPRFRFKLSADFADSGHSDVLWADVYPDLELKLELPPFELLLFALTSLFTRMEQMFQFSYWKLQSQAKVTKY